MHHNRFLVTRSSTRMTVFTLPRTLKSPTTSSVRGLSCFSSVLEDQVRDRFVGDALVAEAVQPEFQRLQLHHLLVREYR